MSLCDYVTLGRSGLRVSPLCLGTMTFGTETGWGMEEKDSAAVFDRYVELGGNFFDTANSYAGGTSEAQLGKFVSERGLRDRAVIATKFTRSLDRGNPNAVGNGRKAMLASLEQSLTRLKTDYVDLYWMHSWDMVTPVEEVIAGLDDLVASGKIRYYGLSDVPAWYATRAHSLAERAGRNRVVALQLEYSLTMRAIEREHLPAMQEFGLALCAWGATSSGFLTGKYKRDDISAASGARLTAGGPQIARFTERNWAILAALTDVAQAIGRSPAQVALNWVATQPGSTSPIVGARSLSQLDENLSALDFTIPDELRARLDEASALELVHPYNMFAPPMSEIIGGGVTTRRWAPGMRSPAKQSD